MTAPMGTDELIYMRWFYPVAPVYEHPFTCIANLIRVGDRVVVPGGDALTFLRPEGTLERAIEIELGTWGSPVLTSENKVAISCLENAVAMIDPEDHSVSTAALPASASTELLVGPDATLYLGVGSYEGAVVCLDHRLRTRWSRTVAKDDGLRHPLALAGDGSLWVPTDDGLVHLDGDDGEFLARSSPEAAFACVSNPVARDGSALVVAVFRDGQCALVQVSGGGNVAVVQSLPSLVRGRLLPDATGGMWLAGSSQDWQEPKPGDDFIWIARLGADGAVSRSHRGAPQTDISLAVDSCDRAWVGTYTYDLQGERGELYGLARDGEMHWRWSLNDPPSGIGAPLFLDSSHAIVPTSNGVVGLELPFGDRA